MKLICKHFEGTLVEMSSEPKQIKENTLESLSRAIKLSDGIEFDVRSTLDERLILHHDMTLSVSEELRDDLPKYVEKNTLSDLNEFGFSSFEDIVNDSMISQSLREHGKLMNIELKLPHISSGVGGGWLSSKKNISYIGNMMNQCAKILNEAEIPKHSVIFYGFFKHMSYAAKKINFDWSVSSLFPPQLRFGSQTLNRIYASSEFTSRSLNSMIKRQKKRNSPILPCALEYFIPPYNKLRLDKTYGLSGKSLDRLLKLKKGFPLYIWPGLIKHETMLYDAGISILSDSLDSNEYTLPEGIARWTKQSTQPLNDKWIQRFRETSPENHKDLIEEATREVSPWHELNSNERKYFLDKWSKKWYWSKSSQEIYHESESNKLPWESVRVIGHRGCGSTSRPIFN
jgi:glycerophosphoryl diester phosphodiesterase